MWLFMVSVVGSHFLEQPCLKMFTFAPLNRSSSMIIDHLLPMIYHSRSFSFYAWAPPTCSHPLGKGHPNCPLHCSYIPSFPIATWNNPTMFGGRSRTLNWSFPKMGVPLFIIHFHPFSLGFSLINHPVLSTPMAMEPPNGVEFPPFRHRPPPAGAGTGRQDRLLLAVALGVGVGASVGSCVLISGGDGPGPPGLGEWQLRMIEQLTVGVKLRWLSLCLTLRWWGSEGEIGFIMLCHVVSRFSQKIETKELWRVSQRP